MLSDKQYSLTAKSPQKSHVWQVALDLYSDFSLAITTLTEDTRTGLDNL